MKRCLLFHKWSEPDVKVDRYGIMTASWSSKTCRRCGCRKLEFYSDMAGHLVASASKVYGPEIRG